MVYVMFLGLFASVGLSSLISARSFTYPLQFAERERGPQPDIGRLTTEKWQLASNYVVKKYGAEQGFIETKAGPDEELVIVVSDWAYARRIFGLMKSHGTAKGNSNVAYVIVPSQVTPSGEGSFTFVATGNIAERSYGTFHLGNVIKPVVEFKAVMDHKCNFSAARVSKSDPDQEIQATVHTDTRGDGVFNSYYHSVNGGQGAPLKSITVYLGKDGGPIITDICPVSLYVRYAE
jgi:hypothetical protein